MTEKKMNDMFLHARTGVSHMLSKAAVQLRRHARSITHAAVTLLPLMALLVGSCNVSQLPWAYGSGASPQEFRTALFPDRVNYQGAHYYPAAGYVSRAKGFIEDRPDTLKMLTRQEIGYVFGHPTLHRQDADAEVWQYKTASCVVDFYFYGRKGDNAQSKLAYIDIRLKDRMVPGGPLHVAPLSASDKSSCLHAVVKEGFDDTRDL
jgi:hypothetical protein